MEQPFEGGPWSWTDLLATFLIGPLAGELYDDEPDATTHPFCQPYPSGSATASS